MTSRRTVFLRWLKHIDKSVFDDSGWLLVGKLLVIPAGLIGVIVALVTYQSSVRGQHYERANSQVTAFKERIGHSSSSQRASALQDFPQIISLCSYKEASISIISSIAAFLGGGSGGNPVFTKQARSELIAFITDHGRKGLTSEESQALIKALKTIGLNGWLLGKFDPTSTDTSMKWVWTKPENEYEENLLKDLQKALNGLRLYGAHFDGEDLENAILTSCIFRESTFKNTNCSAANFLNAKIDTCQIDVSKFTKGNLKAAEFLNCDIRGTVFYGVMMDETLFRDCIILGANFDRAKESSSSPGKNGYSSMSRIVFNGCIMSDVNFSHAVMSGAQFTDSENSTHGCGATVCKFVGTDLRSANFKDTNFEGSEFILTRLDGTTAHNCNFRYCNFTTSSLDDCTFESCDFTGAKGLCPRDNIDCKDLKSSKGLKFINPRGLTNEQVYYLRKNGASVINDD